MNFNRMNRIFEDITTPFIIAGPCAVENYDMLEDIIVHLLSHKIMYIRAGLFKPRTSFKSFQGLGLEGIPIINSLKKKYGIRIISEVVDIRHIGIMAENVDVIQIGARNMFNFELLKELGRQKTPILLKRGISATVNEFICAAEYILSGGNNNLIMCERGLRTFETATRNTLDLSCVAILKKETELPVIVDISHSLGRKDIMVPIAKAALAAGADGIMAEVHNNPEQALSDAKQQMSLLEFDDFCHELYHT